MSANAPCSSNLSNTTDWDLVAVKRRMYSIAIPIIVLISFVVMLVNGALLIAVRLIKRSDKNRNPTLPLTISLAVSDLSTSIAMTFSVVYNSYLYSVLGLSTNACVSLTFEALRMGGLITSSWHLLALAFSHYLNISQPNTFKQILTPKLIRLIIVIIWFSPPLLLSISMLSLEGEGFRTPYHRCYGRCWRLGLWSTMTFRLIIFFAFVSPFLIMSCLYLQFLHLSRRQDRLIAPNTMLRRKRRTFMTTVCIWVTFFLFWIPTCLVFLLTCATCPITNKRFRLVFAVGVLANLCILCKSLINPIIYAVRIPEIKNALLKQYGWLFRRGAFGHHNQERRQTGVNEYDILLKCQNQSCCSVSNLPM